MEDTNDWPDSLEDFLEIVDALPTNQFASVPPVNFQPAFYNAPLQASKVKTRLTFSTEENQSPSVRTAANVKELLQRLNALEELVHQQNTVLHDLYSYIHNKLSVLEQKIIKKV